MCLYRPHTRELIRRICFALIILSANRINVFALSFVILTYFPVAHSKCLVLHARGYGNMAWPVAYIRQPIQIQYKYSQRWRSCRMTTNAHTHHHILLQHETNVAVISFGDYVVSFLMRSGHDFSDAVFEYVAGSVGRLVVVTCQRATTHVWGFYFIWHQLSR